MYHFVWWIRLLRIRFAVQFMLHDHWRSFQSYNTALSFQKIRQDQLISNGRVNKNYTAPDCGLAPNCTVERRGDTNSKLTCQFNYPGAIGQVSSRIFRVLNLSELFGMKNLVTFGSYFQNKWDKNIISSEICYIIYLF